MRRSSISRIFRTPESSQHKGVNFAESSQHRGGNFALSSLLNTGLRSWFREAVDDPDYEDGVRRPLCAGMYTQHLKHEDTTALLEVSKGEETLSLVCVADGHGGKHTSEWLRARILPLIVSAARDGSAAELQAACRTAFAEAHEAVKRLRVSERGTTLNTAGSTLTVLIFNHARREIT